MTGVTNNQNQTYLLYRLGSNNFSNLNPVYKLDTLTGSERLIMNAFSPEFPGGNMDKTVNDYEFFPNQTDNSINIGDIFSVDAYGYIARNDSVIFIDFSLFKIVEISRQNPSKVFVSNLGSTFLSIDSGYTWHDSLKFNYPLVSLSQFNDNVMFGIDNHRLVKSTDGGNTYIVVDTSYIEYDNQNLNFIYDGEELHIYRTNRSRGKFVFYYSSFEGDPFKWTKSFESESPIYISKVPLRTV